MENSIIQSIKQRILAEQKKHPQLDWSLIAASKIYSSYIENNLKLQADFKREMVDLLTYRDNCHKYDKEMCVKSFAEKGIFGYASITNEDICNKYIHSRMIPKTKEL